LRIAATAPQEETKINGQTKENAKEKRVKEKNLAAVAARFPVRAR
jgi:hypothetical protein